jgi:hypothetical protein
MDEKWWMRSCGREMVDEELWDRMVDRSGG